MAGPNDHTEDDRRHAGIGYSDVNSSHVRISNSAVKFDVDWY